MAKASATKRQMTYSVHPAVEYLQAIVANLPDKTGRSLDQWLSLMKKEGPKEEAEQVKWLKAKYGLGGTTAGLIAERARQRRRELGRRPLRAGRGWIRRGDVRRAQGRSSAAARRAD